MSILISVGDLEETFDNQSSYSVENVLICHRLGPAIIHEVARLMRLAKHVSWDCKVSMTR
uniref:Uncharacterized protein n=1 Tax=Haemonchus contortus TaxID=6289 RepID=A0A7I4YTD6_HAECO